MLSHFTKKPDTQVPLKLRTRRTQLTLNLTTLQQLYKQLFAYFTDEVSDELVVESLLALDVARLGLKGVGRRLVTLLQAGTDLVPGCHDSRHNFWLSMLKGKKATIRLL